MAQLLSGGNRQIPTGEGDAPVQAYIAAMPGWKRALGRRLDSIVALGPPGQPIARRENVTFATQNLGFEFT